MIRNFIKHLIVVCVFYTSNCYAVLVRNSTLDCCENFTRLFNDDKDRKYTKYLYQVAFMNNKAKSNPPSRPTFLVDDIDTSSASPIQENNNGILKDIIQSTPEQIADSVIYALDIKVRNTLDWDLSESTTPSSDTESDKGYFSNGIQDKESSGLSSSFSDVQSNTDSIKSQELDYSQLRERLEATLPLQKPSEQTQHIKGTGQFPKGESESQNSLIGNYDLNNPEDQLVKDDSLESIESNNSKNHDDMEGIEEIEATPDNNKKSEGTAGGGADGDVSLPNDKEKEVISNNNGESGDNGESLSLEEDGVPNPDDNAQGSDINNYTELGVITHNIESNIIKLIDHRITAVAAGDDEVSIQKGIWISGLYNISKQGVEHNIAGYNSNSHGVTIGFDIELNDNLFGIAYSNVHSNFKFKNARSFNKSTISSHVISFYGQKKLKNNFSIDGVYSLSRNHITYKVASPIVNKYRHKNNSYSLDTRLNYNISTNRGLMIIPNVGIRYGQHKNIIYSGSDFGAYDLSASIKAKNLFTGIVGTKVIFASKQIAKNTKITPGLHVSIEKNFNSKDQKIHLTQSKNNALEKHVVTLPKQNKIGYNIGASLLVENKNTKVRLEYDCHLRKKYQSHQGVLSFKMMF